MDSLYALQSGNDITSLLSVYPPEAAAKLEKNKGKLAKISEAFDNITTASVQNAIVMTCNPNNCPYKNTCILISNDLAPDGYKCPIERKVMTEVEFQVINSLEIDRNDPIEMELLWDLIDAKILDMRASASLSDGDLMEVVLTESKMGSSKKFEMDPVMLIKLELKKLKHNIMDEFCATRRSKRKFGIIKEGNLIEQLIANSVTNEK